MGFLDLVDYSGLTFVSLAETDAMHVFQFGILTVLLDARPCSHLCEISAIQTSDTYVRASTVGTSTSKGDPTKLGVCNL